MEDQRETISGRCKNKMATTDAEMERQEAKKDSIETGEAGWQDRGQQQTQRQKLKTKRQDDDKGRDKRKRGKIQVRHQLSFLFRCRGLQSTVCSLFLISRVLFCICLLPVP